VKIFSKEKSDKEKGGPEENYQLRANNTPRKKQRAKIKLEKRGVRGCEKQGTRKIPKNAIRNDI